MRARGEAETDVAVCDDRIATAGHDLRNALQSIKLNATLLAGKPGADPAALRRGEAIQKAVARANGIVEVLAEHEAAERRGPADAGALVRDAVQLQLALAHDKAIELLAEVSGEPGVVHGNAESIGRILSNLVSNAVKFTPAGGRVTVRAERLAAGVRFEVSDTGPGIPAEHLPRLFERGFRGDPSGPAGLGLGLSIARELAEAQGARIELESVVGRGATFSFTLA